MKRLIRGARRVPKDTSPMHEIRIDARDIGLSPDGEIDVILRASLFPSGKPRPALLLTVSQLQIGTTGMPELLCEFGGVFLHRGLGDLKYLVDTLGEQVPIVRASSSSIVDAEGEIPFGDFGEALDLSAGVLLVRRLFRTDDAVDVPGFLRRAMSVLLWLVGILLVDLDDLPDVDPQWLTTAGFEPFADQPRFLYFRNV